MVKRSKAEGEWEKLPTTVVLAERDVDFCCHCGGKISLWSRKITAGAARMAGTTVPGILMCKDCGMGFFVFPAVVDWRRLFKQKR